MIYFKNLEEAKQYAKTELEKTDFIMLSDVNVKDKDLWIVYRQQLRSLYFNPILEINFDDKPSLNWISDEISAE